MKKSSPYLADVTLDVPGAILDEATDAYIDCYGPTILGKFNANSPQQAIDLGQKNLPASALELTKDRLFIHVFELRESTD